MDYLSVKLFHLVGIMLLFLGLGGMGFASYAGFGLGPAKKQIRRATALLHGIGLLFILVSGMAMLHSLGLLQRNPPGWVKAKFLIFLPLGGSIALAARFSRAIWILIPAWFLLGTAAVYLAVYKPF